MIAGRPIPVALIALEKGVSTLAIFAGAVLAFAVHHRRGANPVELVFPRGDPHNFVMHWLIRHVPYVPPHTALAFGIGLIFWGLLFAAETVGVWIQALWGELLVIIETAAFLPLEFWNIATHHRPLEFITTPINLAILAYLLLKYRSRVRQQQPAPARHGA